MAEILRIVEFPYRGARPTVVSDLSNGTTTASVRDSFKVIPATKNQQYSESQRRYGGATLANETHSNGAIEAQTYITGTDKDNTKVLYEGLIETMERLPGLGKRYVEWRPDGSTHSVFFEVRGNAPYEPLYRWVVYQGTDTIELKWSLSVAPLAEGLSMYGVDRFDPVNDGSTLDDYEFVAGAASDVALSSTPLYALETVANHTTQKIMLENLRNYENSDWFAAVAFEPDDDFVCGVVLKYVDDENYVSARASDDAGDIQIDIVETVGGADNVLATDTLTIANYRRRLYALEANMVGAQVSVAVNLVHSPNHWQTYFQADNLKSQILSLFGTTFDTGDENTSRISAPVTAGALGPAVSGRVGLIWTPGDTNSSIHEWCYSAFTATADNDAVVNATTPFTPSAEIPGSAPAKVDIFLRPSNSVTPFALLGWTYGLKVFNHVWNGDFNASAGWSTAAQAGLNSVAATSLTFPSTPPDVADLGHRGAVMTLPANDGAGIKFPVYGEFKKGETYTFAASAHYESGAIAGGGAGVLLCGLGVSGADKGTAGFPGFNGVTFDDAVGTWTPDADTTLAWFFIARATGAAGSTVFHVDSAQVFQGTELPTIQTQVSGRGAYPLFGAIPAPAASEVSGDTTIAGSGGRYGSFARTTTASTADFGSASWWVDPHLTAPDEFGSGEVSVEVWAHVNALGSSVVTPRFVLSAVPGETGTLVTGSTRYTEFGDIGVAATAGLQRLGVISFPVDAENEAGRWKLTLTTKYGNGSSGNIDVEALFCVPATQRAVSPTGLDLDDTYPYFTNGNEYFAPTDFPGGKLLKADGSAAYLQPNPDIDALYTDHALGGALCQPEAGKPLSVFVRYARGGDVVPGTTVELGYRTQLLVTPRYNLMRGN